MRIGYFADGQWSHKALDRISRDPTMEVRFVCARWDNPDPVLRKMASDYGIHFMADQNVNSDKFIEHIQIYSCDIFVSMSFNQIFRRRLYSLPPLGTINCHAGKLPSYRGRNILNWALINDEKEFGITVHYVDDGIDTGDLILQNCYPISESDNYGTLRERASTGCAQALYDALAAIRDKRANRIPQSSLTDPGFYCTQRRVGDERMNWNQNSRDIFNFVRAICFPGPKARTSVHGIDIDINRVDLIPNAPIYKGIAGAVIGVADAHFLVKTADSFVRVVEWGEKYVPRIGDRLQ